MTYKVEANIVYWWNGKKWLVKESCTDATTALALKQDLENRDQANQ